MIEYLRVGRIANTHGLRGEIKVIPTTDDVRRFDSLEKAYIDRGRERLEVRVTGVKYLNRFVVLRLAGYDHIDEVLPFKNADLMVHRTDAVELPEGADFVGDIIGCKVVDADDGAEYGTVGDVLFTGANDVYVVKREGAKDLLIPVIDQCIVEKDVRAGIIRVHLLKGLDAL
ncbi:MAG: ribosome maturation factor RimM [Eubacteriales bacterium]|nr:ribosome maturation factor RimM [Eubacteriales bacterium]